MNRPVKVTIWSSSHGTERHHLPRAFDELEFYPANFKAPLFRARGGLKIDPQVVDNIITDIKENQGTRQVVVVILGDNNIRNHQKPYQVSNLIKRIVTFGNTFPLCCILVVGMIPCPRTNRWTEPLFRETDRLLQTLIEPKDNCWFIKITKFFKKHGRLQESLFSDRLHLSPTGAKKLATLITAHLFTVSF